MIILDNASKQSDSKSTYQLVLVFGIGLIGETLKNDLLRRGFLHVNTLSFTWLNTESKKDEELQIVYDWVLARITTYKKNSPTNNISLNFVWCAGKGGFTASWKDLDVELKSFKAVT